MKIHNKIMIISVLFIIFSLFLFTMAKANESKNSTREGRSLATKPEFSVRSFAKGEFQDAFDLFVSENVYKREALLDIDSFYQRWVLLKESVNDIFFGRDGYLVKMGAAKLRTDYIYENAPKVIEFSNRLKEASIDNFYVFIVANNGLANSDKVSSKRYYDYAGEAKDIFIDLIKDDVKIVDTCDEMIERSRTEQLYFKTDHHWTYLGAYYGYNQLISAISEDFPEVDPPHLLSEYKLTVVNESSYGSAARRAGVSFLDTPDEIVKFELEEPSKLKILMYDDDGVSETDSLFLEARMNATRKYASLFSYYSGGSRAYTGIYNESCDNGLSIAVIKDSFMNVMLPYLVEHFTYTHVYDLRSFNKNLMEDENFINADMVVFQMNAPVAQYNDHDLLDFYNEIEE